MDKRKSQAALRRLGKLLALQYQLVQRQQAQLLSHTQRLETLQTAQADAMTRYGTACGEVPIDATLIAARINACHRQTTHLEHEAVRQHARLTETRRRHKSLERKTAALMKKVTADLAASQLHEAIELAMHKSAASLKR
jgi:hypothetical protein